MGASTPTQSKYLTVQDAANRLGVTPWEVMRLVQTGVLQSRVLIETASLDAAKENQ